MEKEYEGNFLWAPLRTDKGKKTWHHVTMQELKIGNVVFSYVKGNVVSAAKVTLEAITRSIALEFAPFGIRANCIQAGITDTASLRMIPGSDQLKEHAIKRNPFNRLTLPEDVANAVYLLSKDEAAWINGTILKVDGGENLR